MQKLGSLLIAAGLLALPATLAHAKITRVIEKSFAVHPGETLKVETTGGSVHVHPADVNEVRITARQEIRADSDKAADEILKDLILTMKKTDDGVIASAKYAKGRPVFSFRSWPPVAVSFDVTVPERYHAILRTSGGAIEVGNLGGKLEARTSGGDVIMGNIAGPVVAGTSGGDIRLKGSSSDVKLNTSGGDIEVGQVEGSAELGTSGGDIRIDGVSGVVDAETSGGDISAAIHGSLSEDCSLETSGGNVRVTVDDKVGFKLDASTSGGDVDASGLAIEIERGGMGKSRLAGPVNGGGPRLKLRTSGGNIVIKAH